MMPELHPGDKVYVRDSLRDARNCNSGLLGSMKRMAGQWVTIASKWGEHVGQYCYYILEDDRNAIWSEDCFDFGMIPCEDEKTLDITELM